ncbi:MULTISPECIES: hypothetical protein [unclassified Ruegeria]|uniref:hypothetical protein n=1 Tax=unclassified Ruegeria TaxID=2625375 RepID=UPI001489A343|nr:MULTISPECIES: hypothetical protein [unclassified Ruegeria]
MFNSSEYTEWDSPREFCLDLNNLCYAFADARTLLANKSGIVPLENELILEFALARLNVLRRFPFLLNPELVNRSFLEMEKLFRLTRGQEGGNADVSQGNYIDALAITHFFQNTLHNFYLMQTRGLVDFNRLFSYLRPAPPVYAHLPPPKYIN